jgi:hypothetical protein
MIFCGMFWLLFLARLGRVLGITPERMEMFESADVWINYGIFVIVGTSFIWRALKAFGD